MEDKLKEQKQEAEEVLKLYTPKDAAGFDTLPRRISIRFAIQNRQSVLDVLTKLFNENKKEGNLGYLHLYIEMLSITNQIDYLKSKL